MSRIAAKLLVLLLVLVVSPLHASSRVPATIGSKITPERLNGVLRSLRSPLSEETFFELVNAHSSFGYVVGSAQAGTQAMVVTINLTLPGNDTATTPTSGSNLDSFFDGLTPEPGIGATDGTTIDTGGLEATGGDSAVDDSDDTEPTGTDTVTTVVDDDWYGFTVDQSSIPTTHLKDADDFDTDIWLYDGDSGELTYTGSDGDDGDGAGLFRLDDLEPTCGAAPTAPLCSQAGKVITDGLDLMGECSEGQSTMCDLLIEPVAYEPGTYFIVVDGFGDATDGSFYSFAISDRALDLCRADEPDNACGALQSFTRSLADFGNACEGSSSDVCSGYQWPAGTLPTLDDMPNLCCNEVPAADAAGTPAVSSGPRTILAIPAGGAGHYELRETGTATGTFEVTESVGYSFSVTNPDAVETVFAELPVGSVLAADGYSVRRAPDGKTFLLRDESGAVFALPEPATAPDGYLIPLTPDRGDPDKTVLTGPEGLRIVIPAPHVEYVDINARPDAIATDPDDLIAAESGNGAPIAGLISSTGGSTGEVFDIRLVNLGKTAVIEGDAVFEPLTDAESDAARNTMARLMAAANDVASAPGEAYCVEQDKAVPTTGELFRLANTGKQRELAFARQVLSGARAAEAAGLLHPDSDPAAYVQSTRQWAIWTAEKSYDKEGFAASFLEHTRKTLEANGTEWNEQVEGIVRDLVDNRWRDVQKVLELAGLAAGGSADDLADAAPLAAAWLALAVVTLIGARRRRTA